MGRRDYRLVLKPMPEVQDERHYGVCGKYSRFQYLPPDCPTIG
jgi:hypothetical protein